VLKDVVLVGAAMVLASTVRSRGRTPAPVAVAAPATPRVVDTREKLAIVLAGLREECPLGELCDSHGIAVADYQQWRTEILHAAAAIDSARSARSARSGRSTQADRSTQQELTSSPV